MPDLEERPRRCFVDTNIWLYAMIDSGSAKREVAKQTVLLTGVVVSTQVINETCVNLLRQVAFSEAHIRELVAAFDARCSVADLNRHTLQEASRLRETYSLSFWDSMIVASALRSGCDVLYTEDMQDGLRVDGKLTTVDPFAAMQAARTQR